MAKVMLFFEKSKFFLILQGRWGAERDLRQFDGIFVGEVAHDLRGEEFGVGRHALRTQKGNIRLQPAAESGNGHTRITRKLRFCVGGRHRLI